MFNERELEIRLEKNIYAGTKQLLKVLNKWRSFRSLYFEGNVLFNDERNTF